MLASLPVSLLLHLSVSSEVHPKPTELNLYQPPNKKFRRKKIWNFHSDSHAIGCSTAYNLQTVMDEFPLKSSVESLILSAPEWRTASLIVDTLLQKTYRPALTALTGVFLRPHPHYWTNSRTLWRHTSVFAKACVYPPKHTASLITINHGSQQSSSKRGGLKEWGQDPVQPSQKHTD